MSQMLRKDADRIISASLKAVLPDEAVQRALRAYQPRGGRTLLVAAGKAAWQMAAAAVNTLGHVDGGVVVTKYGHVRGEIPGVVCCEGGHPVPDEGSFAGTQKALDLVQGLTEQDTVLFLLSGGGSALFEKPLIPGEELQDITRQLLACGADIVEMNTIRKRLSAVKGGRFAELCAPAQVFSIVLSDILSDPLDMIASGPAYPDSSTCAQAQAIVEIRAGPQPGGAGTAAPRDPQEPFQCDDADHRQCAGAVRRRCRGVPRHGIRGCNSDRPALLRGPGGRKFSGQHPAHPCRKRQAGGFPGGRRDGCPSDRQGSWRPEPGTGAGSCPRHRRAGKCCGVLRGQ